MTWKRSGVQVRSVSLNLIAYRNHWIILRVSMTSLLTLCVYKMISYTLIKLGPSHRGGGFLRFVHVSSSWGSWCSWGSAHFQYQAQVGKLWWSAKSMQYMQFRIYWMHRRGRKNFCWQKSRMPLAGLVYLPRCLNIILHGQAVPL